MKYPKKVSTQPLTYNTCDFKLVGGLIMANYVPYTFGDINESNINALDKYIKTIIINTKKHFLTKEDDIFSNELFLEDLDNSFNTDFYVTGKGGRISIRLNL